MYILNDFKRPSSSRSENGPLDEYYHFVNDALCHLDRLALSETDPSHGNYATLENLGLLPEDTDS